MVLGEFMASVNEEIIYLVSTKVQTIRANLVAYFSI